MSFCGSRRREGRSFAQGNSARAVQRCRSTAIAANGGRTEASPASGVAIERWHSGFRFAARLQRRTAGFEGAVMARSTRDPSSTGEGRRALNGAANAMADLRSLRKAAPRADARIGCSGVCPCVGSAVAEIVGRQSDPEKRVSTFRVNIAERTRSGDGGLAGGNFARRESGARRIAGERAPRTGSSRKHT